MNDLLKRIDASENVESKANAAIDAFIKENTWALKAVWHYGDGEGGDIFGRIREAVTGHYFRPPREKPYDPKKRIRHSLSKKVFERDAYRCKHCGTYIDLTVDHIKPESKGGTLDFDNLQTLCRPCNSRKNNRES